MALAHLNKKPGAALALCTILAVTAAAQNVTLRFTPAVGKKHTYVMTNDMKSAAGPGFSMGQTMNVDLSILSKSAQGTKVRMKIASVKMKSPPGSPGAGNMSQLEKRLVGSSADLTYDARARLVGQPTSSNPQMSQVMGQMGAMGAGFMGVEFPAGPIGPGAKWSTSIDIAKVMRATVGGMMQAGKNNKIPVSYKLVGIQRKGGKTIATIAVSMAGKVDLSMGNPQGGAQRMNMQMSMNMQGTIVVDASNGLPTSGNSKGTVGVSMGGAASPMNQNVTTTFKLK